MTTIIDVRENNYKIAIGNNLDLDFLEKYRDFKICVICDNNVYSIYKDEIEKSLEKYNFYLFKIDATEENKNLEMVEDIYKFLLDNNFTRSDIIFSIGGGITGDIAGFVASTFLRGIEYIQVPTTLLSMVDSSVGGKTGVNLENIKNQVGSFYFPSYVHIDTKFLGTLSDNELKCGLGEIIKYAILDDTSLIDDLYEENIDYIKIIDKSINTKLKYVYGDEKDRGKRQFLNLGHTIGHAIESNSDFKIPHGIAILIGLIIISKAAYFNRFTDKDISKDIIKLAKYLEIPIEINIDLEDIMKYIEHDKKVFNDEISVIIPIDMGKCVIEKFTLDEFREFIKKAID